MSDLDYDLFVIGAGSGGVRAARMAAGFGARVAVAEDRYMGGTCVNVGCVPKKLYVYASEYGKHFEDARGFGWDSVKPAFDWSTLRDNKSTEIARLNAIYDRLLDGAGCEVIDGRARIIDANTVAVGERHFTTRRILIATGGWPYKPDFEGRELAVTSNEIFDLPEFPERLLVVGGGYIAVEFAGIFNGLGSRVTQLYRGPLFLRGFDTTFAPTRHRRFASQVWTCASRSTSRPCAGSPAASRRNSDGRQSHGSGRGALSRRPATEPRGPGAREHRRQAHKPRHDRGG
jgi:glutathione reductase (NADPH)